MSSENNNEVNVPTTTFGDLRSQTRSNKLFHIEVFPGVNLGRSTLTARMTINELINNSFVGNKATVQTAEYEGEFVAQRNLLAPHARQLAGYVLRGLVMSVKLERERRGEQTKAEINKIVHDLSGGPYAALQPIVANIRNCKFGGTDLLTTPLKDSSGNVLAAIKLSLTSNQKLAIVDGQHRRRAFELVKDYLENINRYGKYPTAKTSLYSPNHGEDGGKFTPIVSELWDEVYNMALNECNITLEIHLGLGEKEEGQLFSDLNSKGKNLADSLVQQFDISDAVSSFSSQYLLSLPNPTIKFRINTDSDQRSWGGDGMTLKDLVTINKILIHGKNVSDLTPQSKIDELRDFIEKFWEVVQSIPGFGEKDQRSKTVAGQPVVIKSLAKLVHDLALGVPKLRDQNGLKKLYQMIINKTLDFDHSNKLWRSLFMSDEERNIFFPGMNDYLFLGDQFKGGDFDAKNNWVRYGAATNDIVPRLGDIIRYQVGLEKRDYALKQRQKL